MSRNRLSRDRVSSQERRKRTRRSRGREDSRSRDRDYSRYADRFQYPERRTRSRSRNRHVFRRSPVSRDYDYSPRSRRSPSHVSRRRSPSKDYRNYDDSQQITRTVYRSVSHNSDFENRQADESIVGNQRSTVSRHFHTDFQDESMRNDDDKDHNDDFNEDNDSMNNLSNTIKKGWHIINEVLPENRLIVGNNSSDKIKSVPVPGRIDEDKKDSKPSSVQLKDTLDNFSEALPKAVTSGLLNTNSLECNAQWYRPVNPLWKPFTVKNQKLPLGLETPSHWNFGLSHTKMGDIENLTSNLLHVSSYIELLSETQGRIMNDNEVLSVRDIENLCDTQEALAAATRDMLNINAALAVNCTLIRRDAILEGDKSKGLNLVDRTKFEARTSSLSSSQLFGKEAENALKAQSENPALLLKQTIKTLHNQSFRKSNQDRSKRFSNWNKSRSTAKGRNDGYTYQRDFSRSRGRGKQNSNGSRGGRSATVTASSSK